jgi:hypothetical protein
VVVPGQDPLVRRFSRLSGEAEAADPAVRKLDPDAWLSLTTEPRFIFFATTAAPGRLIAPGGEHR